MKTEQLIDLLSSNLEPVDRFKVFRSLTIATVSGLAFSSVVCIVALGMRPDLNNPEVMKFLFVKIGFGSIISILGWRLLLTHTRPGEEKRSTIYSAGAPFVGLLALAAVNLMFVPASQWAHLVAGERLLQCLLSIPVMAIVPFAIIVRAARDAAPTNLPRTGALAGLVAGGIGAAAYALHCPNDSLPFVAVWYGGAVALCVLTGAVLGVRLLRW
ncbi:NrsF family protein [Rhodoplanes sp. Z2-YC6860]|uniref:NrsF family protein n=1 Tax=Rhodoplanes sp. Z2-YC6860 TaxID=674703 RepID=UPI00078C7E69|nr:DUF1109 domain-containing protein [Rhodoplanes sp. Z2-YC6860]AMN45015.1 NAD-dependent aldehyde dehydrogenase [Rhodoplanes sp. Z2-YC6860]